MGVVGGPSESPRCLLCSPRRVGETGKVNHQTVARLIDSTSSGVARMSAETMASESVHQDRTEDSNYAPLWILSSSVFFAGTNLLLRRVTPTSAQKNAVQTWKWRNIANSFIHSFITGIWSLLCFYWHPKLAEDLIGTSSTSSHLLVSFSIGYFIYDFLDMAIYHRKRSSYELMVHHFFVIACFGLSALSVRYIGYAVVALLVEVNSIFLHLRQLFIIQGIPKMESVYRLNSLFNIGTFLVFRILTLGWMTRWLVLHREAVPFAAYTIGSIALAVIVAMNIVLFFRILHVDFIKTKGRSKKE